MLSLKFLFEKIPILLTMPSLQLTSLWEDPCTVDNAMITTYFSLRRPLHYWQCHHYNFLLFDKTPTLLTMPSLQLTSLWEDPCTVDDAIVTTCGHLSILHEFIPQPTETVPCERLLHKESAISEHILTGCMKHTSSKCGVIMMLRG